MEYQEKPKILAIIQARMGSTRLPGKMLLPIIDGKGALELMLERVSRSKTLDKIVIATTVSSGDDLIEDLCRRLGYACFRGSENDVLDRYYRAAKADGQAGVIVRLTGDCPLHDPAVIDKVVTEFFASVADFGCNNHPPTYPDGLDVEVFSFSVLERAWRESSRPSEREHVRLYMCNHPELFKTIVVAASQDYSRFRWTLDEEPDYQFIRRIYEDLYPSNPLFNMQDILSHLEDNRQLMRLNERIMRDEGLLKSLEEEKRHYDKKGFGRSLALLERAKKATPVGAQTYSKSYRYFCGNATPYFVDRGIKGHVWDVDGNEYVDFILALGAVTVGYNNSEVYEAVSNQLAKGISFSQATVLEVELAEKLIEIIPCAEMVRFLKNGSDATTAAVRLARAATDRDVVAVCGYHGMHDWYIGSTTNRRGIPRCVCELSHVFEYNNILSLEKIFENHSGNVAAVILEPVQYNGPRDGFLEKVKELANRDGAVLIFDEVISGFRLALGGAQEYYGVVPDLAAIGKGMANGMPISAIVGKKELLKLIERGVFISTTFGGEALSLAAALKTIEILQRPESFAYIWDISERLMDACVDLVKEKGLDSLMKMCGLAPHSGFLFKKTGSLNANDFLSVYQQRLLERGILSLGINNFCLEHTQEDIDRHIEAVSEAIDDLHKALDQDSIDGILRGPRINPIFKRN